MLSIARPYLKSLVVLSLLLGALLGGCASVSHISIAPTEGAEVNLESGLISQEKSHRVTLELVGETFSSDLEELPTFVVQVENRGEEPVLVTPENVRVFSGAVSVEAYTPAELAMRIEEAVQREADEYTGQQAEVFLQSDATRRDPSSAMATISAAKRANRAAAARESRQRQLQEAENLLSPISIQPGDTDGGIIKLNPEGIQSGEPLRVVVTVDEEAYEFRFEIE